MPQPGRKNLSADETLLIARAIGDKTRFEILKRLAAGALPLACVSIRDCMAVNPATLSHHMKELEQAGLVDVIREGKFASYTLRRDVVAAFLETLASEFLPNEVSD